MTDADKKRVEEIRTQNNGRITQYFLQKDADNIDFLLSLVKKQFDELQSIKNWHTACEEQVSADGMLIEELLERLAKSEKRAEAAITDIRILVEDREPCEICKHLDRGCIDAVEARGSKCFEWRGNDPTKEDA